jgi:hypothetical protein
MAKLGFFVSVTAVVAMLGYATVRSTSTADAADACVRKEFKTEMVKEACAKGGQKAAKDAMKAFNKDKKIKSCNQCHSKLAPTYELKADGLKQFQDLGGKVIGGDAPAKDAPVKDTPAPKK